MACKDGLKKQRVRALRKIARIEVFIVASPFRMNATYKTIRMIPTTCLSRKSAPGMPMASSGTALIFECGPGCGESWVILTSMKLIDLFTLNDVMSDRASICFDIYCHNSSSFWAKNVISVQNNDRSECFRKREVVLHKIPLITLICGTYFASPHVLSHPVT